LTHLIKIAAVDAASSHILTLWLKVYLHIEMCHSAKWSHESHRPTCYIGH